MALQHLGELADRFGEVGQVVAPVGVELHLGKDLRVQANLLAVQQGHLLADHPFFLQPLDAPPARRLRQADAFGDLGGGKRRLFLQQGENPLVMGIQCDRHIYSLGIESMH
ncbi:hypothetical protein D3C76_814250 [compost metagenome]